MIGTTTKSPVPIYVCVYSLVPRPHTLTRKRVWWIWTHFLGQGKESAPIRSQVYAEDETNVCRPCVHHARTLDAVTVLGKGRRPHVNTEYKKCSSNLQHQAVWQEETRTARIDSIRYKDTEGSGMRRNSGTNKMWSDARDLWWRLKLNKWTIPVLRLEGPNCEN